MKPIVWVLLVLVVVALVAAALWAMQQRRRARLQQRFGPEYERVVERTGNRRAAEQQLAAVADRRDALDIRELSPASRQRWIKEWDLVQVRFVDAPADAVASADTLLTAVMRERGYPVDDFEERASLVAADHPLVVERYRAAHAAYDRHRLSGATDTEDLRQSFVHYRALFAELVEPGRLGGPVAGDRVQVGSAGAGRPDARLDTDARLDPRGPDRSQIDRSGERWEVER